MNAKQKLHLAQLQEWSVRCADQKASGLTIRQWCDKNQLSFHKFNYWKHLLKEEAVDQMLPDIAPLYLPASGSDAVVACDTGLLSSRTNRTNRTNCTIRANHTNPNVKLCIDGVAFELEPSIPEDFLRSLIRAVHYA